MAVIAESMTKNFRFPVEEGWGAGGFPLSLSFLAKRIGPGTGHRGVRPRIRIWFMRASRDMQTASAFFEA